VWNQPSKSGSRTPNRSKSPSHRRHLSSSSVTSTLHDGLETVTTLLAGKLGRARSPSGTNANPHRDSAASLGIPDDRRPRPRSRSGPSSRPQSRSRSRHQHLPYLHRHETPEPVVMHAHKVRGQDYSLGTHVPFRDVCRVIKDSAFADNPLPIIVSLEVHADTDQQDVMVRIMKEEWGDLLLDKALENYDPRLSLPTLMDLQNKILVKVKRSKTGAHLIGTSNSLGVPLLKFETDNGPGSPPLGSDDADKSGRRLRIAESLSSLAIYTHSEHFRTLDDRSAKTPSHIFSLDENDIASLHETQHRELFRHNRAFFMRAYPGARRVDSSNLDPARCWRKGVQMAALNWQYLDEGMMLNAGMFAGEDGWVLKPRGFRSTDGAECSAQGQRRTLGLRITVLAGQHVPLPAMRRAQAVAAPAGGSQVKTAGSGGSSRAYEGFRPCVKVDLHVEKAGERCEEINGSAGRALREEPVELKKKSPPKGSENPDWGPKGFVMDFKAVPKVLEELSFVR
jgi:phosphatidylinositol phospholipase C, delta